MWLWLGILLLWMQGIWGQTCKENVVYCPWVVYYGVSAPLDVLKKYDPVVLDPGYSSVVKGLNAEKKTVYGYLSLGEVANSREYFKEMQDSQLLLKENPNWPGSYFVDVRKEAWARMVLDRLIPGIIAKGFHGIFLDTLDNAVYLEETDPETYAGMKKAAAQLVQLIGVYFPTVRILMNRGFGLLPEVGDSIHGVVAESFYTEYNFKTKVYAHVPEDRYKLQIKQLKEGAAPFPHLQLFSLDYWYPDQPEQIKEIYKVQRENGFRPYVSVYTLDQVVPEP